MKTVHKMMLVVGLAAFAGCGPRVDVEKEMAAILQADKDWVAAALDGHDIDRIVSFWADDAIVYPPGAPAVIGKEAIKQFTLKSFQTPGFSIWWQTDEVIVSRGGDLAYTTGRNRFTFNDPVGKTITSYGKDVTVWRKDAAGTWKAVIDIWNEDPSPAR
jgi:ketosteroid isomerase-like protein